MKHAKYPLTLFVVLICSSIALGQKHPTLAQEPDPKKTPSPQVGVIELRNYLIRPGQRDEFISYFEQHFIEPHNDGGGFLLGQYRVKGADDNFFWIRGFKDMETRSKFLNTFYYGDFWKAHKKVPNSLLLNNDNVHLLRPLNFDTKQNSFDGAWFGQTKGVAVIDYYVSNTKLKSLISFVQEKYNPLLTQMGIVQTCYWVSEQTQNDFKPLPVFQDENLLVQITFFQTEKEYKDKMKILASRMDDGMKAEMSDLVTIRNTIIIYPTENSFRTQTH